jgi:hypothetical protein
MKRLSQNFLSRFEIIFLIIVIILYPFLFIFFGLDYTDGPYHYLAFEGLRTTGYSTFLSTYIGYLWTNFFGNGLLGFRGFAAFIMLVTQIIPAIVILRSNTDLKTILRFIAIGVFFSTAVSFNLLQWDVFSWLVFATILTLIHLYLLKVKIYFVVIFALLTAIAAVIRLPNILIVFVLIILFIGKGILDNEHSGKTLIRIFLYLGVSIITYYLFWWFIFKSNDFFNSNFQANNELSTNAITNPMQVPEILRMFFYVLKLIPRYLNDAIIVLQMLGILTLITVIWKKSDVFFFRRWIKYAVLIAVLFSYFFLFVLRSNYNINLSLFYIAFALFSLIILAWQAKMNSNNQQVLFYILVVLTGFISAFGSNTGLLKMSGALLFVLPVLLTLLSKSIDKFYAKGYYTLILLIVFFSIVNKVIVGKTYEDGRVFQLTKAVSHPKLKGIVTTDERKKNIEEILTVIDSLKQMESNPNILFYGVKSHLFRYLTNSKQLFSHKFVMKYDDELQAEALSNNLVNAQVKPIVCLIFDYPEKIKDSKLDPGLIGLKLIENSFTMFREGNNYQFYYHEIDSTQIKFH